MSEINGSGSKSSSGAGISHPQSSNSRNGGVTTSAQLTWSVDGSNSTGLASDANSGLDDTHPLSTFAELGRRINGTVLPPATSMVVRVLSDMGGSDGSYLDVNGSGIPITNPATPLAQNGYLTIVGVPTVTYSGTVSAAANATPGTNADNHFTDAGSPPAFATVATIWKRTNGQVGWAWPQKDLGGGVFRTSKPSRGLPTTTWVNGDSYSIMHLPTIHDLSFPRTSNNFRTFIALINENTANTSQIVGDVLWYGCQFVDNGGSVLGSCLFYNCRDFLRRTINQSQVCPIIVNAGGLISNGPASILPAGVGYFMGMNTSYLSFQGITLSLDYATSITELSAHFYDCADCISVSKPNCNINAQFIGGSGNTGKIFNIQGAHSSVIYANTPAAGMTSDGLPFQVRAATAVLGTPIVDANFLALIQTN